MILLGMVLFIIANIGFEGGIVFYDAFLPSITSRRSYGRVSGYGFAMGYLGALAVLFIVNLMLPDCSRSRLFLLRSTVICHGRSILLRVLAPDVHLGAGAHQFRGRNLQPSSVPDSSQAARTFRDLFIERKHPSHCALPHRILHLQRRHSDDHCICSDLRQRDALT